jgi:hypothetical protein
MGADISRVNAKGDCSLKCAYNFNYHASNSVARTQTGNISITYESSIFAPVTFNELKYQVTEIELYQPSIHTYNGVRADAEIYILHKQEDMDYYLAVCIPINSSNNFTEASKLLTDIINTVASNAPKPGNQTTLNLGKELTLQSIVPVKPFISYEISSGGFKYDVVAFESDYAIPLTVSTLNTLRTLIKPISLPSEKDNISETFYNPFGPNHDNGAGDDIYISCQPTGASGETIQEERTKAKNTVQFDYDTILKNPMFVGLFVMFFFIIFLFIVNAVYGYIFVGKNIKPSSTASSSSSSSSSSTTAVAVTKPPSK